MPEFRRRRVNKILPHFVLKSLINVPENNLVPVPVLQEAGDFYKSASDFSSGKFVSELCQNSSEVCL